MYYELATLTLPFGTAGQAAAQVQAFASAPEAQGELLACWTTDIGELNRMIVLRGFADVATLEAERQRTQNSASPFGCGDLYQSLSLESFRGFPWMKPVRPSAESGIVGPVYGLFGLGLILYFASQGAGRLLWPVLGNIARLVIAAVGGWLAWRAGWGLAGVFAAQALALVAYGGINAAAIAKGVWFRD